MTRLICYVHPIGKLDMVCAIYAAPTCMESLLPRHAALQTHLPPLFLLFMFSVLSLPFWFPTCAFRRAEQMDPAKYVHLCSCFIFFMIIMQH